MGGGGGGPSGETANTEVTTLFLKSWWGVAVIVSILPVEKYLQFMYNYREFNHT